MDYQKFKEQFVEDVKRALYEKGVNDIEVSVNYVEKVNESYDAMTIRPEGSNIGANLRLEYYHDALQAGVDYEKVVDKAIQDIEGNIKEIPTFDLDMITDYAKVRNKLSIEVVSAERNSEILEDVPHRQMEDMAIVYKINLDLGIKDGGTVLVNNSLLERYEITQEQLHEDAINNAAVIKPVVIKGMSQVLTEMMDQDEAEFFGVEEMGQDEAMFVATVPDKTKGAGVLAYDNFMDYATEKLGGDFFVLPSSVHEILLVKDDGNTTYDTLKEMVEQVNATEVRPEDKLTDSVYHYDSKNRIFELGEKFEARRNQEISAAKTEKGSVLKDLREKQAATADKTVIPKEVEKTASKVRGGEVL